MMGIMTVADIWQLLADKSFAKHVTVAGYPSVAHMFRNKRRRCGIYVLHFSNGEFYVGKTFDIVKRYSQHRKKHGDIERISFRPLARKYLTAEEKAVTLMLQQRDLRLRNINIVDFSYAHTNFETVMSQADQLRWRDDPDYVDAMGERPSDARQRSLYTTRYASLAVRPFADEIIHVTGEYVRVAIPAFRRSEMSFWNCTARATGSIYVRINAGWQTVFDAGVSNGAPWYKFYMTEDRSVTALGWSFLGAAVNSVVRLPGRSMPKLGLTTLKAGGDNQVTVIASGSDNGLKFLGNPKFVLQLRAFNLGLVQKSPCMWSRNHCLDLADRLLES